MDGTVSTCDSERTPVFYRDITYGALRSGTVRTENRKAVVMGGGENNKTF